MANKRGRAATSDMTNPLVRAKVGRVRTLKKLWHRVAPSALAGVAMLAMSAGCTAPSAQPTGPTVAPTTTAPASPTATATGVPEPVEVTIETRVEGVPEEASQLAEEAFGLFDHPFPASWDAPRTIAELEPLVADTVLVTDWISTGAEPGSVMLESTKEGYWAEISTTTFFKDLALNWHCAWLNEFISATEDGQDDRANAAYERLAEFPDLDHVRERMPNVDQFHRSVVLPLAEGNLKPAKSHLEHCRSLEEG